MSGFSFSNSNIVKETVFLGCCNGDGEYCDLTWYCRKRKVMKILISAEERVVGLDFKLERAIL